MEDDLLKVSDKFNNRKKTIPNSSMKVHVNAVRFSNHDDNDKSV